MEKAMSFKEGKLTLNKHELKIRLVAIVLILIVCYAFGEMIVRIAAPQILYNNHMSGHHLVPKEVAYDPDLGWSPVKNYSQTLYNYATGGLGLYTVSHNSLGFRGDHEIDRSKKIIILSGDSFVYGFGVDDKNIVSAKLNGLLGDEYEVVNLGVGGYGTDQEFLRYLRDGANLNPIAVIHAFYPNDFSNIVSEYQYDVYKPQFTVTGNWTIELKNVPVPISPNMERSYPKDRQPSYKGFELFMRTWSHLYVLFQTKMPRVMALVLKPQKLDYFNSYKDGIYWSIEDQYTDVMRYSFALNAYLILQFKSVVEQQDASFIFVILPDPIAYDENMQKATLDTYYNVGKDFFDFDKPYPLLEDFARSNNISVINMYPILRDEFDSGKRIHLQSNDPHLNNLGTEIFAQQIYDKLVAEGIVPKK